MLVQVFSLHPSFNLSGVLSPVIGVRKGAHGVKVIETILAFSTGTGGDEKEMGK